MSNVYYNPGAFGLELIDSLDEADMSYEYHTLIVLRHIETGRIYWAEDSGCSCPCPFEDYHFSGFDTNLTALTEQSWDAFEKQVGSFPAPMYERIELLDKVRPLLHCGPTGKRRIKLNP